MEQAIARRSGGDAPIGEWGPLDGPRPLRGSDARVEVWTFGGASTT